RVQLAAQFGDRVGAGVQFFALVAVDRCLARCRQPLARDARQDRLEALVQQWAFQQRVGSAAAGDDLVGGQCTASFAGLFFASLAWIARSAVTRRVSDCALIVATSSCVLFFRLISYSLRISSC